MSVDQFVEMSQLLSDSPYWVQGGGGNTSTKLSSSEMVIKASGCRLGDIDQNTGWVSVDHKKMTQLFDKCQSPSDYSQILSEAKMDASPARASMESGFHAFLGKYVAHTHPQNLGVLLCAEDFEDLVAPCLQSNMVTLPYFRPGFELSYEIAKVAKDKKFEEGAYLLASHGMITYGKEATFAVKMSQDLDDWVKKRFDISALQLDFRWLNESALEVTLPVGMGGFEDEFICPDQVIFFAGSQGISRKEDRVTFEGKKNKVEASYEMLCFYCHVIDSHKKMGVKTKYLSEKDVNGLLELDSEKYRKKLMEK